MTRYQDVQNIFFKIMVRFQFNFWKKTQIQFGMSLVQFGLKTQFDLDIIVIYY